ncbi:hypothetical protein [Chryseobacterium rhizoplanae]|uniref:hypothetical protein n=1 Tax=Chryseobacterium rhizoplanae TaxID=1609531 RepID=UPI00115BFC73|nr:hypothetical protein [Chryseobacterium rhizoplanae]
MKKLAFLCILVFSLTSAQIQTNFSKSKKTNSKEIKSKVATNSSVKKHGKDTALVMPKSFKENTRQSVKSISYNIENVSGDQYSFKGFGTSNGPAIILHSSNGTSATPIELQLLQWILPLTILLVQSILVQEQLVY